MPKTTGYLKLNKYPCLRPCIFCIGFEYLENLQSSQTEEAQDHELVEFENLVIYPKQEIKHQIL